MLASLAPDGTPPSRVPGRRRASSGNPSAPCRPPGTHPFLWSWWAAGSRPPTWCMGDTASVDVTAWNAAGWRPWMSGQASFHPWSNCPLPRTPGPFCKARWGATIPILTTSNSSAEDTTDSPTNTNPARDASEHLTRGPIQPCPPAPPQITVRATRQARTLTCRPEPSRPHCRPGRCCEPGRQ